MKCEFHPPVLEKFMSFGNNSQQDNMMSEINVTPLVDVMLVLLVVFIVTAPLLAPQSLKVTLPKTTAVSQDTKKIAARMSIDAQGRVELENQALTDTQLTDVLKQRGVDLQFQLQIEADTKVPYGRVAEIMAIAQRSGVSRLSFVTISGK
jgi:biopolymer transport protein ExbD